MSAAKKTPSDFEDRFFDLLENTIKGIDKKVDKISDDQATNSAETRKVYNQVMRQDERIKQLEKIVKALNKAVFPEHIAQPSDLPAWYRDPNLIKLFSLIFGAIILLVALFAGLKGIKLPGIFGG